MKNNQFVEYNNVQDSVPSASAGTGTISSVNNGRKIVGVGTSFTTEVNVGDWIFIKDQSSDAFRKVINIVNDLELTIASPFTTPLAAAAFDITPASRLISIALVPFTSAANIDGVSTPAGFSFNLERGKNWRNAAGNFVDPVFVDSTVNTSIVYVLTQY